MCMYMCLYVCMYVVHLLVNASMAFNNTTTKTTKTTHELHGLSELCNIYCWAYKFLDSHTHIDVLLIQIIRAYHSSCLVSEGNSSDNLL